MGNCAGAAYHWRGRNMVRAGSLLVLIGRFVCGCDYAYWRSEMTVTQSDGTIFLVPAQGSVEQITLEEALELVEVLMAAIKRANQ
jgi:hypothetical protein